MATEVARLSFGDGTQLTLELHSDQDNPLQWVAGYLRSVSSQERSLVEGRGRLATEWSNPPWYHPLPQDGIPGVAIAKKVHAVLGGELTILVEPGVTPPGVEY